MYIYHDRLTDNYKAFSTLQALSNKTGIPYNTLINHFTRNGSERYITRGAEVIVKSKLIKNRRK